MSLKRLLIAGFTAFSIYSGLAEEGNLLPNSSFENGLKDGWFGNVFDKGPGVLEISESTPYEGKFCARLYKETGPGGTQLFSPYANFESNKLKLAFYYRGAGTVLISFWNQKEGGKYEPVISPLGKAATIYVELKKTDKWVEFTRIIDVPPEYMKERVAVRFQFQVWGGESPSELFLDAVSIVPSGESRPEPPLKTVDLPLRIKMPETMSGKEASDYGALPEYKNSIALKDGLIMRNGKAYFWVGDGDTVGASQSHIASLWMARVLKSSFSSLDHNSSPNVNRKDDGIELSFPSSNGACLYSVMRELLRYQILSELPISSGTYAWSPLKKYEKESSELRNVFFPGSHFYCYDHNTPAGRKMLEGSRASIFRYVRNMPFFGMESYRELGYTPSQPRVREGFRKFAEKKYGTLSEANKVWRRNYQSWEEVQPPHLDSKGILDEAMQIQLRAKVAKDSPEMYYDWMCFVQLDLAEGLKEEKKDFRKWSESPFTLDLRAHTHYSDGYAASDPALIDEIVDIFFLHRGFVAFEHRNNPTDLNTLNTETLDSLLAYNFFRTNSRHALWNSECIVSTTSVPGSSYEAMKNNDIGQFHGKWAFRLDEKKEGLAQNWQNADLDEKDWSSIEVPGAWDESKEFSGKSGWAWYRKSFKVPSSYKADYADGSRKFLIYGKGIAQKGTVWINGRKIGDVDGWATQYQFDVGSYLNFGGDNQITVFVDGTGFSNGIRFYIHLLANDMINESKEFGKKQYASLLWTYMMQGSSAVSLWNWNTVFRPYMPELINEVNSVSEIVLPSVRNSKGQVAMLYPYLYAKGLPFIPSKDYNDYMNYYNAFEFKQLRTDVFDEANFSKVNAADYSLAVFPYAGIVQPKTWNHFKKYVNEGGIAVVSFNSMLSTFERYKSTELEAMAGIKILPEQNDFNEISINDRKFTVTKGDFTGSKGVRIKSEGASVLASYPDKSPAVTEYKSGKGRIIFIAARLDLFALQELLKNYLPVPEIALSAAEGKEYPFISVRFAGNDERKVLYLYNWGGSTQNLSLRIPEKYASGFKARNIRGNFKRIAPDSFKLSIEGSSPAVMLLESEKVSPLVFKKVSPEHQKILDKLVALDKDGDGSKPSVLFLGDLSRSHNSVGRPLYPMLSDALQQNGFETKVLDYKNWTAENLSKYKMLFLAEDWSPAYSEIFDTKSPFKQNILDYVKNGGSLFIVGYTGLTTNAQGKLFYVFGPELGIRLANKTGYDPAHCAFGDPLQITSSSFSEHELAKGLRSVQFFVNRPCEILKNSPMKAVVLTNKTDENLPEKAVVLAGEYGAGRIIVSSDLTWMQPFRIECGDNSVLLMNSLSYLLRYDISDEKKEAFRRNLFITQALFEKIEASE